MSELQEYKITITRESTGMWKVAGYWYFKENGKQCSSLDGQPQYFKTRKEALEFCMVANGIPE